MNNRLDCPAIKTWAALLAATIQLLRTDAVANQEAVAIESGSPSTVAGGEVNFNNRVPGVVDARWIWNGTPLGEGWTAQLYGGPVGGPLLPLFPKTSFRSGLAAGYIQPVVVTVPGIPPGGMAVVEMRVFNGPSFESSSMMSVSLPIYVTLGGGLLPPANLAGLRAPIPLTPPEFFEPPRITRHPQSATAHVDAEVEFTVQAASLTPFTYQWSKDETALPGQTNATLTLNPVRLSDAGSYRVAVRNQFGETASSLAVLTVAREPAGRILFQDADGFLAVWTMDELELETAQYIEPKNPGRGWRICGTGDFNNDAEADLLFEHTDGSLAVWFMRGNEMNSAHLLNPSNPGAGWRAAAVADFNRDGHRDIAFQHSDGTIAAWLMNGRTMTEAAYFEPRHPGDARWKAAGSGDLDGDGNKELVFQNDSGRVAVWFLDRMQMTRAVLTDPAHAGEWKLAGITDLNHDERSDLLFQHSHTAALAAWLMNGWEATTTAALNPSHPGGTWTVVAPR